MPTIPNNVDWSATAAWIALAVSIIGTIASPLITTWLNNKHQLKMYELEIKEKHISVVSNARTSSLEAFIANIGKCIANCTLENQSEFGYTYSAAYQYIPDKYWPLLDSMYEEICHDQVDAAMEDYKQIIHIVADLLKEPPQ